MSDASEFKFVDESSRCFRKLVEWAGAARGRAHAIAWVGSKAGLTKDQARRVYDANLIAISTGKYLRILKLYGEQEAIEARKTELVRQIAENRRRRGLHAIAQAEGTAVDRESVLPDRRLVRQGR